ncbi:MAG: PaaI family thioesterase [Pseudomonadota bacterium]
MDSTVRYGVSSPDQLRSMSGRAFLEAIAAGDLPQPPICQTIGFRLVEVGDGRAVFVGATGHHLMNPIGSIHGGFAATLLDSCMACAVQTIVQEGQVYTTLEIKVNMVRALTAETGQVTAIGDVVHAGRRIATSEGRLVDDDGKLYAHGTTTCLIMDAP